MWHPTLIGVALLAFAQDPPPGPQGFRFLDFDAARFAAQLEARTLLVDFYDPQSDEWKVMRSLTWSDAVLVRWLDARVVAVQYDIREHAQLAQRLGVSKAPASVFLTPEGVEVDRIVGFVEAKAFMAEGLDILRCTSRVGPARAGLLAAPHSPWAHVELAQSFLECRRYSRALEHFLWAWDNGAQRPEFSELRRTQWPQWMRGLVTRYPAARDALIPRRDRLQAELLALGEGADPVALAHDVSALNTALSAERRQLQLFEQVLARPEAARPVVDALYTKMLVDLLVREKRWAALLEGRGDILVWLDREYASLHQFASELARNDERTPEFSETALEVRRNGVLWGATNLVEALCATKQAAEARRVADFVVEQDSRGQSYYALVRSCARGGAFELAEELIERAARSGFDEELPALRVWVRDLEAAPVRQPPPVR